MDTSTVKPPPEDLSLVRFHIVAALVWMIVGMVAGTFLGYRLTGPQAAELGADLEWFTYGRMRMFHTHAVIFGWLSNGFFAFTYYAVPRLTGRPLLWRGLAGINGWLVQVALLLGAFALVTGQAEKVEYAEAPWWADVIFALTFVIALLIGVGTILASNVKSMYVSLWYIILGFIFTALNFVMTNTLVAHVVPGAAGAALEGLWIHNAVGLWVTPMGVAIVYYLLPVILKKPIASHKLSLLGFWTLAVIYPLGGSHHFFFSPMPWWLQVVAMPLTAALIFVVYSVVYNFFATMRGHWRELASNIPLRFLTFGIFNYIVTCTQGPFHALLSVQKVVHFTDWVVAHAHLALFGVFSWWLYAFIYWVWPKISGRALSRTLGEWHFWLTLVSFWILYYIADTVAGLMQGFYWLSGQPLINSLEAAEPFWVSRAVSGVLLVAAAIIFVINLVRGQKGEAAHV